MAFAADPNRPFIGIKEDFTIADALAVSLLRKDHRFEMLSLRKVAPNDTDCNCVALLSGGELVLNSSFEIKEKTSRRSEGALRHDACHVYEATVEVVDTVHWSEALPFMATGLRYPNAQKEDLLSNVQELSAQLKKAIQSQPNSDDAFVASTPIERIIRSIGLLFNNVLEWYVDEWLQAEINVCIAMKKIDKVHACRRVLILQHTTISSNSWTYSLLEAYVRDRLQQQYVNSDFTMPIIIHAAEQSSYRVVCLPGTMIRSSGERFLFPLEWTTSIPGRELSERLGIDGVISVSRARNWALAKTLPAAYELAMTALQHACGGDPEQYKPTPANRSFVRFLATMREEVAPVQAPMQGVMNVIDIRNFVDP